MKRFINLLPPEEARSNQQRKISRQIIIFGSWLIFSMAAVVLILAVSVFILDRRLTSAADRAASQARELADLEENFLQDEVRGLNRDLANFQTLRAGHENWSRALAELARLAGRDMTFDEIAVSRPEKKIRLSGHGASRDSVLELRRRILASDYFLNVNFPLKNLEKSAGLEWQYEFYVNAEKLK